METKHSRKQQQTIYNATTTTTSTNTVSTNASNWYLENKRLLTNWTQLNSPFEFLRHTLIYRSTSIEPPWKTFKNMRPSYQMLCHSCFYQTISCHKSFVSLSCNLRPSYSSNSSCIHPNQTHPHHENTFPTPWMAPNIIVKYEQHILILMYATQCPVFLITPYW